MPAWGSFEPESITDTHLPASLGLDCPEADIPDWMMTNWGAGRKGRCYGRRVCAGTTVHADTCIDSAESLLSWCILMGPCRAVLQDLNRLKVTIS